MANLAGYDIASYGNMLNHYTRHTGDPDQAKYTYRNGGIDKRRTHLNYAIYEKSADLAAEVRRAIDLSDVKPRTGAKATNVLSDLIVTLPRNERLEGREREFFEAVYRFIVENYVHERYVLGAWVHMDETQPHMHFAFVPLVNSVAMTNDKSQPLLDKDGKPKLDGKGTPRYKRVPKLDESGKPSHALRIRAKQDIRSREAPEAAPKHGEGFGAALRLQGGHRAGGQGREGAFEP